MSEGRPCWIPATVLLDEIRARGYNGDISILSARLKRSVLPAEQR
jgi:hypothetical protein